MTASSAPPPSAAHPAARFAGRLWHYLKMSAFGLAADAINRVGRRPVTGSAPVVVSLTSHGKRIQRVHRTIESIARGQARPRRLVLWLGSAEASRALPAALKRLQGRGLEIAYATDRGPHTKYFPYAASVPAHEWPLVTADDDIWYPAYWLQRLCDAHQRQPAAVHCHRARRVQLQAGQLAPYGSWPFMDDDLPGPTVFATGVGGVIYPPALLDRLRDAGPAFTACCPQADDLWLHVMALRSGVPVRQIGRAMVEFNTMPSTQSIGLQNQNVGERRNDVQAAATYTPADLALISGSRTS